MLKVEYLAADEDGTWRLVKVEIPDAELEAVGKVTEAGDDAETLIRWAGAHLRDQAQYRRIVLWAPYCVEAV